MILNSFIGGLNKALSPHLLNNSEAQECLNVDLEQGSVKPLKGILATVQTIPLGEDSFTRFKGQWLSGNSSTSFVEYNDVLYYSTSLGPLKRTTDGLNIYDVGVTPPIGKLSLSSPETTVTIANNTVDTSDLVSGTELQYRIVYDDNLGNIKIKEKLFNYTGTNGVIVTCSASSFKLYRAYEGQFRFVGEGSGSLKDLTLDISENTILNSSVVSVDTVRQYVYTYYSSVKNTESAPNEISDEISIESNNVDITGFMTPSDPDVDVIKLYRIGDTLTDYYLVEDLVSSVTSYTDTKTDLEVLNNDPLTTKGISKPKEDLKFLTEYNDALFACIDSTLYYSEPGLVDRWSEFNFIKFPEHITGLGSTQNGLLVFSRNKTWIITGNSQASYSKYLLHGSQGCVTHNTIAYTENNLIWYSLDGICVSNGSGIKVVSYSKYNKLVVNPITAEVAEDVYYLFHDSGVVIMDLKYNLRVTESDIIVRGANYNPDFDKLYILLPGDLGLYEFKGSTSYKTMKYKTGYLTNKGLTNIETYKSIYLWVKDVNNLTFRVYKDTVLIKEYDLENGFNEVKLPQVKSKGYFLEFEFEGKGEILEIEFEAEGRQNGR